MTDEKLKTKRFFPSTLRAVLTALLMVLMLAGTFFGFTYLASMKSPPDEREAREIVYRVTAFDAHTNDIQRIITGFGTVKADREVVISAQVSGEVVQTNPRLEIGEKMIAHGESERTPPDLLLRIDPTTYQQRVTQAESLLAADQAELARLQKEETNQREVLEKAAQ
ncbi:MAG: hypothetical protein KDA65_19585, partial [Planctomycetaceae bacterium]|nr:hypothetical protein [Planctomycetaceae bacterium]